MSPSRTRTCMAWLSPTCSSSPTACTSSRPSASPTCTAPSTASMSPLSTRSRCSTSSRAARATRWPIACCARCSTTATRPSSRTCYSWVPVPSITVSSGVSTRGPCSPTSPKTVAARSSHLPATTSSASWKIIRADRCPSSTSASAWDASPAQHPRRPAAMWTSSSSTMPTPTMACGATTRWWSVTLPMPASICSRARVTRI